MELEKPAAYVPHPSGPALTDREFDIRGQICPSCLLSVLREVNTHQNELSNGTLRLCVLSDNRDATATIPAAAEKMGYRVAVRKDLGHYVITIEK